MKLCRFADDSDRSVKSSTRSNNRELQYNYLPPVQPIGQQPYTINARQVQMKTTFPNNIRTVFLTFSLSYELTNTDEAEIPPLPISILYIANCH